MAARLGATQTALRNHLIRYGDEGAYIGPQTVAPEGLRGLELHEVLRSLALMEKRGLVRREGVRYILTNGGRAYDSRGERRGYRKVQS